MLWVIRDCTSASEATAGGGHLSAAAMAASSALEASDGVPDGSTPRGITLTAGRQRLILVERIHNTLRMQMG